MTSTKLIKDKKFLLLISSQAITWFGNSLHQIAFTFFLYQSTKSAVVVGNSLIFAFIPSIIFSPFIGMLVDKYPKKYILIFSDLIRGIFVLLIPSLINSNISYFYIIQFILATMAIPFSIGQKAFLSEIVSKDNLIKGNGIITSIKSFFKIIGPALAGILVATINIKNIFYINASTFFISAAFISLISTNSNIKYDKIKKTVPTINMKSYIETVKNILTNNILKHIIIVNILAGVLAGANNVLILVWIKDFLGVGAKEYGILTSMMALGFFLGSVFMSKSKKDYNNINSLNYSCLILAISFSIFSITTNLYLLYIIRILVGISLIFLGIITTSLLQENIPQQQHGKLFSFIEICDNTTNIFSICLFGLLSKYINSAILLCSTGILLLLYILIQKIYSNKICYLK